MRVTTVKKGAIDLDSVFSPGFLTDTDGKLITGYKWEHFLPNLNPNSNSETVFQMPQTPHVVNNIVLLYMFVNGVKVEPNYLTLNPNESTEVIYDDTDYPIVSTDVVDIWYVAAATVGGQPINDPLPQAQAAGSGGHLQINNGSDAFSFAPIKWIAGALVPDQDSVYDLGTQDNKWHDLHLSGETIYLGDATLSFDSQTSKLSINGAALATENAVDPQTLIQNQDFVAALQGPQGVPGPQGDQGAPGETGAQGATGPQGAVGPQGPTGLTGPQGPQGLAGIDGQNGAQGPQGPQGDQGIQGPQGTQGPQGAVGPGIVFKGAVNSDPSGSGLVTLITAATFTPSQGDAVLSQVDDSLFIYDGSAWADGGSIQGPQGIQGIQGLQGPQGIQGANGVDGAQGPQGPQGLQGPTGASGASVTNLTISGTTIAATLSDNSTISGTVSVGLTNLTDVDLYHTSATITDGHVLTYDTTHGHWHPEPIQTAAANIAFNDLSDVSASTITDHIVKYDGTEWSSSQLFDSNLIPNVKAASTGLQSIAGGSYPDDLILIYPTSSPISFNSSTLKVSVDGATLDIGDVFLIKDGGDASPANYDQASWNGFWKIVSYPNNNYARCERFTSENYKDIRGGNFAFVEQGLVNAGKGFVCTNTTVPVLTQNLPGTPIYFSSITEPELSLISEGNTSVSTTDSGTNGTITFNTDGTNRWAFESSGHLIPAANATYDIGEAENKVRHLYLSDNSILFDSGTLGVDDNDDLSFTPNGGSAQKIATQDYVAANSGGGGGAEKMIVQSDYISLNPTYYPTYAFSKFRTTSTSYFDTNYKILTKTITGTTLTNEFGPYPTTNFPPGDYKFTWAITVDPSIAYFNNLNTHEAIAHYIYTHSYSALNQLSIRHTVHNSSISYKPVLKTANAASLDGLEITIQIVFTLSSQSFLQIWQSPNNSSYNWLGANVALYKEYQEIEKLNNYNFTGALTL